MLTVNVPTGNESYNESTQTFINETVPVRLEHSLHSMSKWEAKYQKPFLSTSEEHTKAHSEVIDYITMMVLGTPITEDLLDRLIEHNLTEIQEYIADKQTATWITERKKTGAQSSEMITSELIYYWMFSYQIDVSCESWHINRLLTLIRIFGIKQEKPEKMGKAEADAQRKALNAQRRAKMMSKG